MKKFVRIQLPGSYKNYDFFTYLNLAAGNKVVCDTRNGLVIGTVVKMIDSSQNANAWVVQKIDLQEHARRVGFFSTKFSEIRNHKKSLMNRPTY